MLQTCPYITVIQPNAPSPIVYMTDTLGPEYPCVDNSPKEASFGIINLDRSITWRENIQEISALEFSAVKPRSKDLLINKYGNSAISALQDLGYLKEVKNLCMEYVCHSVQIEITSHCNWACKFCPVSISPKAKSVMSINLFEERIKILKHYNMKLTLSTNASALTKKKIDLLVDSNVVHVIWINLPSIKKDDFYDMTQSKTYKQCMKNIDYLSKTKLPIRITVNGVGDEVNENAQNIIDKFVGLGIEAFQTSTCDRAGALKDTIYDQNIYRGPAIWL